MFSVKYLLVLAVVFIATEGGVSVNNPFYCYSKDPIQPQIGMFSINTPYEAARGQTINANVSSCTPSKFWMLGRHGTRLPNANVMNNMLQLSERLHIDILSNYDEGKTALCASDIELIRNWRFDSNMTVEQANYLTSSGWDELEGQARRYQAAFPSILSSAYSPSDYLFRGTGFHRTDRSLDAFADGLFGVNGHEQVQFEPVTNPDLLLRGYINCPLYQQVIAIREEQDEFREGPEYQEMTTQVSAKLGFHASHTLRNVEFDTLAATCKYEQGFNLSTPSPYCAALSVANHQVYEYYWDLDIYYRHGYGYTNYRRLFENLNCFLMQNLLQFLQSNDVNDHKARIFNTHNPTFIIFLVNFGVFEDDIPLTRHNFAQQTDRQWRSSLISPMGGNLAVIRYDCADGDNDVLFLLHERPLPIPGCEPTGLCKQSFLFERFGRFLNANCTDVFCSNTSTLKD